MLPPSQDDAWFPSEQPPPPPPQPPSREQYLSAFEREVLAGRVPGQATRAGGVNARAGVRRVFSGVVAAVVAVAVVEAAVVAWLGYRLWSPAPSFTVERLADDAQVVVPPDGGAAQAMQVAFAPDSRWVRVTAFRSSSAAKAATATSLRVLSPVPVKVMEGTKQVGSAPGGDMDLPPGRHELRLINESLDVSIAQTIEVQPGETIVIHLAPAPGTLSVQAPVGSEISLNGDVVGRAPIETLVLTPGEYQVVVKHPKVVTERQRVTVKSGAALQVQTKLK